MIYFFILFLATSTSTKADNPDTVTVMPDSGDAKEDNCPNFFQRCKIVEFNVSVLMDMDKDAISFYTTKGYPPGPGYEDNDNHRLDLKRVKTWKIDQTYLTFFKDITPDHPWGETICMYSATGARCTFFYHDGYSTHKSILWQPESDTYVLGALPFEGNHPFKYIHGKYWRSSSKSKRGLDLKHLFKRMPKGRLFQRSPYWRNLLKKRQLIKRQRIKRQVQTSSPLLNRSKRNM